jgi:alkyldihydroxyacetonephosphate synthase
MTGHIATTKLLTELRRELGASRVWSEAADLEPYQRDAWPLAAKWQAAQLDEHRPAAVVRVTSVEDVRKTLQVAASHGRPVIAVANRSSVTGAAIPPRGAVVLDVLGLDRILAFSGLDATVTVEAGVCGGHLEEWLNHRGSTLGHYPQSLHTSSVGGWVSTRSSGTFSTKYGGIENLIAGLQVVLADGSVLDFSPTPRRSMGPELMQLFCGSEGTLGIITQVTLRVARTPLHRRFVAWSLPDLPAAFTALRTGFDQHVVPAMIRLYDSTEAQGIYRMVELSEVRPLLLLGHEGHPAMVQAEAEVFGSLLRDVGGTELGSDIGNAWNRSRFDAAWLREGNAGDARMADAIELSVPWSAALALYRSIRAAIEPRVESVMAHWSHFYSDGCALYLIFTLFDEDNESLQRVYADVWDSVMDLATSHRAALSHHHGVGLVRSPMLSGAVGYVDDMARRVKGSLDPSGMLNPGKLTPT